MKLLKWLDQTIERIGMRIARYYLDNFCHYK